MQGVSLLPSLGPGGVETTVVIGVVVAVAMVILILIILAAFVAVLVCLKHKTTSESERRWVEGVCAGCTSPSRLLCFIYTLTSWPLP